MKKLNKKLVVATAACAALLVGSISTSLAWLVDKTEDVTNTFTSSNIGITLTESEKGLTNNNEYKMVPGWTIKKDPIVSVAAGSEDCYVFIKVEESGSVTIDSKSYSFDDFIDYTIDTNTWALVPNTSNVYYKEVTYSGTETSLHILGAQTVAQTYAGDTTRTSFTWDADHVLVKPTVTKAMMTALTESNTPKLTFTAYAAQMWKSNKPDNMNDQDAVTAAKFPVKQAWELAQTAPVSASSAPANP